MKKVEFDLNRGKERLSQSHPARYGYCLERMASQVISPAQTGDVGNLVGNAAAASQN